MGKQVTTWAATNTTLTLFQQATAVSIKLESADGSMVEHMADLPTEADATCAQYHVEQTLDELLGTQPEVHLSHMYAAGAAALTSWAAEAIKAYKDHLLATAYCAMYELELAASDPADGIHVYCDTHGAVQPDTWVPWSVVRSELERNHKFPQEAC